MTVPITKELARRYNRDIILFLEEQYILPETGKLIVLEEWQKEDILRPLFYDLNPDGTRKYTMALLGMPKKNGKSSLAAGIALWFMFAGEQYGEVIIAANNLDQASLIIYNKVKAAFMSNPNLRACARIYKRHIEMRDSGTVCRPIAHKYETAAGVNPTLVLFDELWGFTSREFFDELTTSPARKNPLGLIVTYAGYDDDSLLHELWEKGEKKQDPEMFYYWSHENKASWVTDKYLATQKRRMPTNVYQRFHENRWASGLGVFITEEDIKRMHETLWTIKYAADPQGLFRYVVSNDLGLSHDRTARAVGHFDPRDNKVYVDNLRYWEGTQKNHVAINEVETDLIESMNRFKAVSLVIDPWQMESTIQKLKNMYTVVPFNFQTDMVFMSQTLVTMLQNGSLVCYPEPELDKELKRLISKQTARGWKIDHVRGRRNDLVVAIGMMVNAVIMAAYGAADMFDMPEERKFNLPVAGIREKTF